MNLDPEHGEAAAQEQAPADVGAGPSDISAEDSPLELLTFSFGLHRRLQSLVERTSREFDLTASEVLALHSLSRRPEPVSEIARRTGLQPNGASVLISRLTSRRLVRRQRSRSDRRVTFITLTDSGEALSAALQLRLWHEVESFFEPLSAADRQKLLNLIKQLA